MSNSTTAQKALPGAAAAASLLQAPGTLAAVTAAFGVVAPEVVLPVTGIIMACSAIASYFATDLAIKATDSLVSVHQIEDATLAGVDHAIEADSAT